jgi:RNA polymerase sigma-70 factor (ECF subfamily)
MTPQEQSLIADCVRGDKAAWDSFVERYSKLVYHTIKTTASFRQAETPPGFADDLFQDVFLSLVQDDFAQLRRFRGDNGCTLASWLRMIAARRTVDHLRKQRRRTESITDSQDHQQANPELFLL